MWCRYCYGTTASGATIADSDPNWTSLTLVAKQARTRIGWSEQDPFDWFVLLNRPSYSPYFFLNWLIENNMDAVFEQHGSRKQVVNFKIRQKLGIKDHVLTYHKPKKPYWMSSEDYEKAPDSLSICELKSGGKLLITTMLCAINVSKAEVSNLYKKRWHIEFDFRDIKTTLGMETLSCKTPEW